MDVLEMWKKPLALHVKEYTDHINISIAMALLN